MTMKIVAVTFDSSGGYTGRSPQNKHYHYKTDLDLAVGDQCVVDTPYGTKLVTVRALEPLGGIRSATKWIVAKVDRERFEERRALEASILDAKQQLCVAVAEAQEREALRLAALRYPEVAAMASLVETLEARLRAIS